MNRKEDEVVTVLNNNLAFDIDKKQQQTSEAAL